MSSDVQHTDVGAYVLGLLEPEDRWRVEAHVAHCPGCRAELPELSKTAAALRAVPPDLAKSMLDLDPVGAAAAEPPPQVFDLVRRRAAADHRRRRRRDVLFAAAVGVVVLAGGVAVGAQVLDDDHSSDSSAESAAEDDELDDGGLDAALPGASAPVVLEGTDPETGAVGTITMEAAGWGTGVGLRLANIRGPLECELVAVTTSGERVVSSWSVPESGYGVVGAPEPLTVEGSVASTPDEITRFDVRTSDGQTLLSVAT
jgi:Putative zinc-finger